MNKKIAVELDERDIRVLIMALEARAKASVAERNAAYAAKDKLAAKFCDGDIEEALALRNMLRKAA